MYKENKENKELFSIEGAVIYFLTHPSCKVLCIVSNTWWHQICNLLKRPYVGIQLIFTETRINVYRDKGWFIEKVKPDYEAVNGYCASTVAVLFSADITGEVFRNNVTQLYRLR
jgi:hypothetical protein